MWPWSSEPVSVSWLSGQALPVQPGAPSLWFGTPFSFGKSFLIAGSASDGRKPIRFALLAENRRPIRSYQGPAPIRSIALAAAADPIAGALRNACQPLAPDPGIDISAIAVQILSAPRRPAPSPVSP